MTRLILTFTIVLVATSSVALAHDGRRFEVKVIDSKLWAQGYNSAGTDDGGGVVRPYYNAIHNHFSNLGTGAATATLPGFDLLDEADELIGHDLVWTLDGVMKWSSPATSGPVVLSPLDPGETLEITDGNTTVSNSTPGSIVLLNNFNGTNGDDLDLTYNYLSGNPTGEIFVFKATLSTSAPDVMDSMTVYTLLSPQSELHHPALYLESQLGFVPEPTTLALLGAGSLMLLRRRK